VRRKRREKEDRSRISKKLLGREVADKQNQNQNQKKKKIAYKIQDGGLLLGAAKLEHYLALQ
jgi:hypothetical protein